MNKNKIVILFSISLSLLLFSCTSEAGETGNENDVRFFSEKKTIYSVLKKHYVVFDTMVGRGFTKQAWEQTSDYDEVRALFDKCINDTHLYINNNHGFEYRQHQQFDEDSIRSSDADKTFIKKTTTNTYYLRYNSCDVNWAEYAGLPDLAAEAAGYDFIVLDFRSNYGGGNYQQYLFFDNLYKSSYSGTIYVTQDNWNYSAGEVWIIANRFKDKLNLKLIGTHSGGMQIYGNCVKYNENGIYFWLPSTSFATNLPENYLGEGKGYEPDIWANKNNMKAVLEKLGLDLSGIVFN